MDLKHMKKPDLGGSNGGKMKTTEQIISELRKTTVSIIHTHDGKIVISSGRDHRNIREVVLFDPTLKEALDAASYVEENDEY